MSDEGWDFKVEIPGAVFVNLPASTWERAWDFVRARLQWELEACLFFSEFETKPEVGRTIYGRELPAPVRSVLVAIAQGHDVDRLLDQFEARESVR